MTCKDNCLHYEVCLTAFSSKGMYLGDDAEEMECFKNKADFVEVVRCKDCKYAHFNTSGEKYHCKRRGYYSEGVEADDFCSYGYGERREE